jgi:anti-sigma factor RsiW
MKITTRITRKEPHPELAPLISAYQDGMATAEEIERVERHLLECEDCHNYFAELQNIRELIDELPKVKEDFKESYAKVLQKVSPKLKKIPTRKLDEHAKNRESSDTGAKSTKKFGKKKVRS